MSDVCYRWLSALPSTPTCLPNMRITNIHCWQEHWAGSWVFSPLCPSLVLPSTRLPTHLAHSKRYSACLVLIRNTDEMKVKLLLLFQMLVLSVGVVCLPSGGRNSSLVVLGLAVHSVAGSILLWGNFPVEGIFPLELTWVQTLFPQKLFRMSV